jgi:hypothetical protein
MSATIASMRPVKIGLHGARHNAIVFAIVSPPGLPRLLRCTRATRECMVPCISLTLVFLRPLQWRFGQLGGEVVYLHLLVCIFSVLCISSGLFGSAGVFASWLFIALSFVLCNASDRSMMPTMRAPRAHERIGQHAFDVHMLLVLIFTEHRAHGVGVGHALGLGSGHGLGHGYDDMNANNPLPLVLLLLWCSLNSKHVHWGCCVLFRSAWFLVTACGIYKDDSLNLLMCPVRFLRPPVMALPQRLPRLLVSVATVSA